MSEKSRAHIFVSGLVQGIFFRAETQKMARELGVFGWVRNTNKGRVEAIFEGEKERVEKIIAWVKTGPPGAVVKKIDVVWEDHKGEFKNFEIK
ncbi:acylphosphatase [Patescibacteria group bacterium]|nr:acylphosphatase [Patescibacteria group bacterium]MBU4481800.1 acylphosphatase [Patescibacteria group bacterium]